MSTLDRSFPQSYWIRPGLFCGTHYPGDKDPTIRDDKLRALVRCGIRRVLNLMQEGEVGRLGEPFDPYQERLAEIAEKMSKSIRCQRFAIPDAGIPSVELMVEILDNIDVAIAANEPVCIHCWGGHGRTGTVAACYLIRHGMSPEEAIRRILELREPLPKNHYPFDGEQPAFIQAWRTGQ